MKFVRQYSHYKARVGERWRKPRGIDSRQRAGKIGKGVKPNAGYGKPKHVGIPLIWNMQQLEAAKDKVIRLAGRIGMRKRVLMLEKATKMGIKVLNE